MSTMVNGGWIKLYRELKSKSIWQLSSPEQKVVLITILLLANHEENKWEWKGEQFVCKPGQLITSLNSLVRECGEGVSIRNVRTALERFEKLGFLTNTSTKTGRLITVVNWEKYQGGGTQGDKASDKDLTKSRQRPDKDLTTNKNDKEYKNDKEEREYRDSDESALAQSLSSESVKYYGEHHNVLLTDAQLEDLRSRYPNYMKYINKLSRYMKSNNKQYSDHWATICKWIDEDAEKEKTKSQQGTKFSNFSERDYNMSELERQLIQ